MKLMRIVLIVAIAFAAGIFVSRAPQSVQAAAAAPEALSLDLTTLDSANFPSLNTAFPSLRSKTLATIDTTAFSLAVGTAPKHTHAATTEVQVIIAGTGTEWLGDKQVPVKPGTFLVIPPNTAHGGFTGGPFRLYVVKTPPQTPDDYHISP